MATLILPKGAPPVPGPVGPGPCTLSQIEQETAARVGPFALLEVLTADQGSLTVEVLKSTIDLGGYDDLYLLRREASQAADRVARVRAYDPTLGQLQPDRRYVTSPLPSEPVEVHHLPPDLLRRGVRAGLRRCWCQFWLALEGADPETPEAPAAPETGPVDLTAYSRGWLRLPQQVLDVLDAAVDGASLDGWRTYQHAGSAFLLLPSGMANPGLTVVASRAHFTLVNGAYAPDGPLHDDDELDVDVTYAAAFGHAELWRIARDRLEAVAAEGRQATQQEAAAEATRLAVANAPWLFAPGQTRKDRVGPLWGLQGAGWTSAQAALPASVSGLRGVLVNGPDAWAPSPWGSLDRGTASVSRTDPVAPPPAGGSPTSSRKPYPWHLLIQVGASTPAGLMLRDGLVGRRVLPMTNFQAPVQEEQTSDIYRERSYSWRKMSLGYGDFTQQSNGAPARYFYASNAWHAGAMRGLGPRLRPLSLAAVEGEVAGFAEAIHVTGGTPVTRLFAIAGRYIRRWEGETGAEQALSLDLGAGIVGRSWTRWTAGGPVQQDALYLTDSTAPIGHLWRYQGAAWTDLTAAGAPPAAFVLATGPELWRVCGTVDQPDVPFAVSKCEGNPSVPANWTDPIAVGDASVPVTGLSELQMRLFVHKADATVWALQGGIDTGTARNLTPDLRESRDPENGKRPAAWLGALYFRAGDTLWRFTGTAAERIGPERLVDNTSPVRGPVGAFCGFGAWYGLGAIYNATTASSYLVQYGNWVPAEETSPAGGAHQFVPAWDGSLCDVPGKRVTALHVTTHESVVGAPPTGGNPLLLVGFRDGTYGWLRLPRDGPSPFTPDAHLAPEDYTDQPAFLRHPRHSLMAPGDVKAYLSFGASGPVLDEARYVTAEYRVDPVGREAPWTALPGRLTQTGARELFPEDTTGRVIDVRERYHALRPAEAGPEQTDFDAIPTPVVATLTLREQLRPAFRFEYAFVVVAHDRVARRDGASDRKTAAQVRNLLVDAGQDPGHVTLTLLDETRSRFALIEFQETVPPDGRLRRRGVAWDLGVSAVAYTTKSSYGIFDRLEATTFGSLDAATFGDLETW